MDKMEIFWKVLPYLSAVVVWFFKDKIVHALNIKKQKAEVDVSMITAHEKNIQLYQEMLDDIDARYKKRIVELENNFNENIAKLQSDLKQLERLNTEFSAIVDRQAKQLSRYKEVFGALPEEDTTEDGSN